MNEFTKGICEGFWFTAKVALTFGLLACLSFAAPIYQASIMETVWGDDDEI